MNLEEKVKALRLVPLTEAEIEKVERHFLETTGRLPPADIMAKWRQWDYVAWRNDKPFFYSQKFIDEHDVQEVENFLTAHEG